MGCPRLFTTVHINSRTDHDQSLEDKVSSVEALLAADPQS
jgi:uncharacterized protein YqgV (UPF0045/DUF77 family)